MVPFGVAARDQIVRERLPFARFFFGSSRICRAFHGKSGTGDSGLVVEMGAQVADVILGVQGVVVTGQGFLNILKEFDSLV